MHFITIVFHQMFLEHLVCNRRVLSPVENEKVNWTERRAPKPHYLMRQGERGRRVPLSNRCSQPCISLSPSSSLAQATWKDGPKTSCNKRQVIVPNRAERGSNTEDGTEKERHWEAVHGALPGPGGQSDPSLGDADSHSVKIVMPFLHFHQETSLLPILKI